MPPQNQAGGLMELLAEKKRLEDEAAAAALGQQPAQTMPPGPPPRALSALDRLRGLFGGMPADRPSMMGDIELPLEEGRQADPALAALKALGQSGGAWVPPSQRK